MDREYLVNKLKDIEQGLNAAKPMVENKKAEYLKYAGDYDYLCFAHANLKKLLDEHDRLVHEQKEAERVKKEAEQKAKEEAESNPEEKIQELVEKQE